MKKLLISLGVSALLIGGAIASIHTNNHKVVNVAAGEKEPRVLSSYSITLE
ncbi:hypothetical protein [Heyndrickxia acidicola]|uniref:Phr family secreted Rap phosphatase inhibitor n=1 Tax=Heyndrickxia acidicola TaxID=209389 RepID=A0ABU6MDA3_9BACI|nr:hypothetical protein [Heyndrickxia acidicola]MED1202647.1 hypothetical protein [Heyndrickxia acidicola]